VKSAAKEIVHADLYFIDQPKHDVTHDCDSSLKLALAKRLGIAGNVGGRRATG
jgi:hypothetical protein